jgi:hypothetical protein
VIRNRHGFGIEDGIEEAGAAEHGRVVLHVVAG